MHLTAPEVGFIGSVPIVAATVPIAVGAALAAKMDGDGDVAIAYFGDGAVEEGVLQESLNLAASMKLPVIFVCENNLFASHLHIDLRQHGDRTERYAVAHGVASSLVDGNDVVAISNVMGEMVARARSDQTASFLEAVTYRWRGHVGPREDLDVGVRRDVDLDQWKKRDPISRLFNGLLSAGKMTDDDFFGLKQEVGEVVEEARVQAEKDPFPPDSATNDYVFVSSGDEND